VIAQALQGCPDENRLVALIEGRLGDDDVSTLEQHVDGCRDCQTVLDELGAVLSPAEPAPAAGASIGRYRVLEPLGAGAMGVVYAAWDPQLRRKVALKLLRPDLALGVDVSAARARLLREARLLASLSHPNIVAVYDAGAHGDDVFMAVELVEGQPLHLWLAEAAPGVEEALDVYLQAARGLAAAHRAGLVHRDVKPANMMLGDDGRVRVTDFGLAAAVVPSETSTVGRHGQSETSLQTASGVVVGTPAYMAPEQWSGGRAGPRADQYSFCVALAEALTGERPTAGATVDDLAEAAERHGRSAPPALLRVVARGLLARPRDRHPDMDAIAQLLEPLLKRRVGGAPAPASRRRAPPRWSWLLAAAVGAGLALTGVRLASRPNPPRADMAEPRPLVELEQPSAPEATPGSPVQDPVDGESPLDPETADSVVGGPAVAAPSPAPPPDAPHAADAPPRPAAEPGEDPARPFEIPNALTGARRAADIGDGKTCLAELASLAQTNPAVAARSDVQRMHAQCEMFAGNCAAGRKRLAGMLKSGYQGEELERAIDAQVPEKCRRVPAAAVGSEEWQRKVQALQALLARAKTASDAKDAAACRAVETETRALADREKMMGDPNLKGMVHSTLRMVEICLAPTDCASARRAFETSYRSYYPELMTPEEYDAWLEKAFLEQHPHCKK
jgi:serine/threonine protein kinase